MQKENKHFGLYILLIGVGIVVITPMLRQIIQTSYLALLTRITGINMIAVSIGIILGTRNYKEKYISWKFFIALVVLFTSLFIANITIRETKDAANRVGYYNYYLK